MIDKLTEFIEMQISFMTGRISYTEYSRYVRRPDVLIAQFIMMFMFFLAAGLFLEIPVYVIIGGTIVMIYGFIMQSKAFTVKQQLLYSFIWAITSFIIVTAILFIAVEFFGFMQ